MESIFGIAFGMSMEGKSPEIRQAISSFLRLYQQPHLLGYIPYILYYAHLRDMSSYTLCENIIIQYPPCPTTFGLIVLKFMIPLKSHVLL